MQQATGQPEVPPRRRVILLGASNLAGGLPVVVETARQLFGSPPDIYAALGHGRSYGTASRFAWRRLPGILPCRVWDVLGERAASGPTYAVVTDIGNDIIYGASPDTLIGWVAECLTRLHTLGARTVMTQLPLPGLRAMSRRRYRLLRRIFYPFCRMPYTIVLERAEEVARRLIDLAGEFEVPLIEMRDEWFGPDAIHIAPQHAATAWGEILGTWIDARPVGGCPAPSLRTRLIVRRARPETRWVFGRRLHRRQPAARLPDGTLLSLY